MLSKGIAFVKLFFASFQTQRNRKKLKPISHLPVFILFISLITLPGTAIAGNWELIPENPVVGDVIEIRGANFTGETAEVLVSFEKDVQVSGGKYSYLLEDVEIPSGFNNRFSVQANGAEDLNVRVKMILWITRTATAKGGIASISQSAVPPGTYRIMIDGESNAPEVKLKITGLQQVKVDSGNFSYKYNTESIPAGGFEIKVEGVTKQVTLSSAENTSSDMVPSSVQKEESKLGNSRNWKSWKIWFGGILAGAILILLYSRIKKH